MFISRFATFLLLEPDSRIATGASCLIGVKLHVSDRSPLTLPMYSYCSYVRFSLLSLPIL